MLVGKYQARQAGEEPRKALRVAKSTYGPAQVSHAKWALKQNKLQKYNGTEENLKEYEKIVSDYTRFQKTPCKAVDIVLYRKDVLEEGNEQTTGADWDIISINGRITEEDAPIHPDTLIANHFQLSGGTATNMTPEKFEKQLRISTLYWKNKAMLESE